MVQNDMSDGDGRNNHPRFQPGNLERNLKILAQFEEVAKEKGVTPAQLTLAWLMAQGSDIIPIPSNKTRSHLEENIKATEIKLDPRRYCPAECDSQSGRGGWAAVERHASGEYLGGEA